MKLNNRVVIVLLLITSGVVGVSQQGFTMGMFSKKILFSPVDGIVLQGGEPVVNAEVVQNYNWAWGKVEKTVRTHTNERGEFHFDEVTGSSMSGSIMPHEPVIHQEILIFHEGEKYKAWRFVKHNYDLNGEFKDRGINMTCRLDTEPEFRDMVFGICTFDS